MINFIYQANNRVNALIASLTRVIESFPPENSKTGLSNCAATSLKIKIASFSNEFMWDNYFDYLECKPHSLF
jgi:hypothetical protein